MKNTIIEDMAIDASVVQKIKQEYFHLLDHVDSLVSCLHSQKSLRAIVFTLPVGQSQDVGLGHINIKPQRVEGRQAIEQALMHYSDFRIHQNQAGVMAKRLPGALWVKTNNECEITDRIRIINQKKDEFMQLVQSISPYPDQQFEAMKDAVPMIIRKAVGRHIPCYNTGALERIRFSMSKRVSMSKTQPRSYWLEKLEKSRNYVMRQADSESWAKQIDIEQKALSSLPESALLRVERPIRKVPIANIYTTNSTKTTLVAHSPIILFDDDVSIGPFRQYTGSAAGEVETKEPIIPRWHLYLKSK